MTHFRSTAMVVALFSILFVSLTTNASRSAEDDKAALSHKANTSQLFARKPMKPAKKANGTRRGVLCITNRLQKGRKNSRLQFGAKHGTIRFVRYDLEVETGYKAGKLADIKILSMQTTEDLDSLFSSKEKKRKQNVLFFIHGFNVGHEESVRRAAQISHELDYQGQVMVFSWPSLCQFSKTAYTTDKKAIDDSVELFRKILRNLDRHNRIEKIQILAHSLGCRLVSKSLASSLKNDSSKSEHDLRIDNVIFAAPDMSSKDFQKDYAQSLVESVLRVRIYHSASDAVLKLSGKLNGGAERLGIVGLKNNTSTQIETVDYSVLGGWFQAHSYFREHRVMIQDIRSVLDGTIARSRRIFILEKQQHQKILTTQN